MGRWLRRSDILFINVYFHEQTNHNRHPKATARLRYSLRAAKKKEKVLDRFHNFASRNVTTIDNALQKWVHLLPKTTGSEIARIWQVDFSASGKLFVKKNKLQLEDEFSKSSLSPKLQTKRSLSAHRDKSW